MFNRVKGITPVIAIVLLLLVTVGAVGVVATQFDQLVEDDLDPDFLDQIEEVDVQTVTRNDTEDDQDSMALRLQNNGDEEFNLTDIARMEYSVAGEDRLPHDAATESFDIVIEDGEATRMCFTREDSATDSELEEIEEFGPGETASCDTGVEMPGPDDEINLHLVEDDTGEEFESYTCSPSTSDSQTC